MRSPRDPSAAPCGEMGAGASTSASGKPCLADANAGQCSQGQGLLMGDSLHGHAGLAQKPISRASGGMRATRATDSAHGTTDSPSLRREEASKADTDDVSEFAEDHSFHADDDSEGMSPLPPSLTGEPLTAAERVLGGGHRAPNRLRRQVPRPSREQYLPKQVMHRLLSMSGEPRGASPASTGPNSPASNSPNLSPLASPNPLRPMFMLSNRRRSRLSGERFSARAMTRDG